MTIEICYLKLWPSSFEMLLKCVDVVTKLKLRQSEAKMFFFYEIGQRKFLIIHYLR